MMEFFGNNFVGGGAIAHLCGTEAMEGHATPPPLRMSSSSVCKSCGQTGSPRQVEGATMTAVPHHLFATKR